MPSASAPRRLVFDDRNQSLPGSGRRRTDKIALAWRFLPVAISIRLTDVSRPLRGRLEGGSAALAECPLAPFAPEPRAAHRSIIRTVRRPRSPVGAWHPGDL